MKLKCLLLISIGFAAGFSSRAFAGNEMGQRWTKIIDRLEAAGISKVGDLDLSSFRQQVQQVSWKKIEGSPESVESGSRQSATYSRTTKQVSMSEQLPQAAMASISQLELHEAMGALGYRDNDYSLSTALTTLSDLGNSAQRNRLKKTYDGTLFKKQNMLMNDGGTSVSGGGDLTTLFIKHQALQLILSKGDIGDQFLTEYPYVTFEPISNPAITQVHLYYKYVIAPPKGTRHESFSMYIPMSRWHNPSQRTDLIREIARKATEIFPSNRTTNTRTFRPEDCPANATATYPATQDYAVASIQSMRASVQMGCKEFFQGQTSVGTMAPALPNELEPQQAGNFYFDCLYTYGKGVTPYRPVVPRGQRAIMTNQIGLGGPDASAVGLMVVSRQGEIEFIQLSISDANKKKFETPYTPPKNPQYAVVRTTYNGIPLTYECKKAVK